MVYVLSSLVEGQNILPMASPQKFATPSHILYVDDIIIFSRGTKKGLDSLMNLFKLYREASGQIINPEKCQFFHGSLSTHRVAAIKS